jgi:glycosyltransferase involved in cell wall biosynthesis
MLIGIDGNEANVSDRMGVNKYAYEIIKNLKKLQENNENPHNLIVYLKNKPVPDMPKESKNFKYKIIEGERMWLIKKFMPFLYSTKEKPDVIFFPSHYSVPFSPIPKVCSIMDLGYLESSGQFSKKTFWQLKYWTANSISTSKYIIAISNATKKDIVRHYPGMEEKIFVTHLGYDAQKFNLNISESEINRVKKKYSIVTDYILYLGTLKPSKNIEGLLDAYSIIADKVPVSTLVIAGKKGWMYEKIFQKVQDLALSDKVLFTDFVDEEDKPALIKGAKVFVLPSFWEGFGIDILSAMAVGTPVVASNVGSLPEVTGGAADLVDPEKPKSIARAIMDILNMDVKRYNGIQMSMKLNLMDFSWEKTARETLKILENAKG